MMKLAGEAPIKAFYNFRLIDIPPEINDVSGQSTKNY